MVSQGLKWIETQLSRHTRPLWGAERIRGEFLKVGVTVVKSSIQKYMRQLRTPRPRRQTGQLSCLP